MLLLGRGTTQSILPYKGLNSELPWYQTHKINHQLNKNSGL